MVEGFDCWHPKVWSEDWRRHVTCNTCIE